LERIVVVSAMPDRLKHETGNGHRRLEIHQRRPTAAPGARAGRVAERSGDRGDVVGLGYDPQGALEVRHADRDGPLDVRWCQKGRRNRARRPWCGRRTMFMVQLGEEP